MTKQPRDEFGNPSPLWTTKEDAKRYRAPKYISDESCTECATRGYEGMLIRVRYASNDNCVHCSTLQALELQALGLNQACFDFRDGQYFYCILRDDSERLVTSEYFNEMDKLLKPFGYSMAPTTPIGAREMGVKVYLRDVPCRQYGHVGLTTLKGECYKCVLERNKVSARNMAKDKGDTFYTPEVACTLCETIAQRRVSDNKCIGCHPRISGVSPRRTAINAGESWYLPETACKHCDTIAERRVDNGQCRGCMPSDRPVSATKALIADNPDMILSRADAKTYGFTVYRTGEKCRKGHAAYRYVSTGNCLECRGG